MRNMIKTGATAVAVMLLSATVHAQDAAKDSNAVIAALKGEGPLPNLCFKGEDGVRKSVKAAFDVVAAGKPAYDRAKAEAAVSDAMVATCISAYVGRSNVEYPVF